MNQWAGPSERRGAGADLLKDVCWRHEAEADGLNNGVCVPPAPTVMPQPRLHCLVQLDLRETAQSITVQVRLQHEERGQEEEEKDKEIVKQRKPSISNSDPPSGRPAVSPGPGKTGSLAGS